MKLLGFLSLRRISGQIAALVIVSIVALHAIITAGFVINRPEPPDPAHDRGHAQLATAVQLLGAAPASERPRLSADIARTFPQLGIELLTADTPPAREQEAGHLHGLPRRIGHR